MKIEPVEKHEHRGDEIECNHACDDVGDIIHKIRTNMIFLGI